MLPGCPYHLIDANSIKPTWPFLKILFPSVNITVGTLEERMMRSGMHTVREIFCCCCGQIVGWRYEAAHDKSQKYKEGKFVLERGRIVDEIDFSSDVYIDTRPSVSDTEE